MQKLKWERNYHREAMRGKDDPEFEWWSAEWHVINCHVHNKDGRWKIIIRGIKEIAPDRTYTTKEDAFDRVEAIIDNWCRDALYPALAG